jgi:hypothetical protein
MTFPPVTTRLKRLDMDREKDVQRVLDEPYGGKVTPAKGN